MLHFDSVRNAAGTVWSLGSGTQQKVGPQHFKSKLLTRKHNSVVHWNQYRAYLVD